MWVKKHLHLDKFEKHERTKRNKDKQSTAVGSTDLVPGGHTDLCFPAWKTTRDLTARAVLCVTVSSHSHSKRNNFPAAPVRRVSRMCACQNWRDWMTWVTEKQQIKEWRGDERERQGRGGEGRGTRIPINSEEAFKRVQTWKCSLRR